MNGKKTDLKFFVKEQTPKLIVHDASRIHKILVNLISNSVKYTKNGQIVTTIDWKETQSLEFGNMSEIKYTVSDTGIGITNEKKRTLFKFLDSDNYRELDIYDNNKASTTPLAGTGLGISQKIAFELGTKIEYSSTSKVGSSFWFKVIINSPSILTDSGDKEKYNSPTETKEIKMDSLVINGNKQNQGNTLSPNDNNLFRGVINRESSVLSRNIQSIIDEVPEE